MVVTTFDSADTLDACLRSVTWADEIVVLDSGSTDATLAIAAHYGARIHAQPFAGYSAQKQAAIDLASHRWVLLLDSDESLPPEAACCAASRRWLNHRACGLPAVAARVAVLALAVVA